MVVPSMSSLKRLDDDRIFAPDRRETDDARILQKRTSMRVGPCPGYAASEIGDSGFRAVFESAGVGIAVAKFNDRIMQSNQTLRHQVLPAESAIYPVKPF